MKTLVQFGFMNSNPPTGAVVLDCRCLRNTFKQGVADSILKARVRTQPDFAKVVARGVLYLQGTDTLWVGCAYGKHRSGAVAEEIARLTGARIVTPGSL